MIKSYEKPAFRKMFTLTSVLFGVFRLFWKMIVCKQNWKSVNVKGQKTRSNYLFI